MTAIALVTGASGGIGRALARHLHAQGCRVAAAGRDTGRLADVEAAVRIAADTAPPDRAALPIATCQEALGAAPTLLAHCVGSTLITPLHRTRLDAYREVMRVNLDSAVFMLQAWIAALRGGPGAAHGSGDCGGRRFQHRAASCEVTANWLEMRSASHSAMPRRVQYLRGLGGGTSCASGALSAIDPKPLQPDLGCLRTGISTPMYRVKAGAIGVPA